MRTTSHHLQHCSYYAEARERYAIDMDCLKDDTDGDLRLLEFMRDIGLYDEIWRTLNTTTVLKTTLLIGPEKPRTLLKILLL